MVASMEVLRPRKKHDEFFGRFEEAAQNNLAAARLLEGLFADFGNLAAHVEQLHALEHKGDGIAHDVYRTLNSVFMPPLDREDIIALTRALDDVMDYIHEAADAMCIYNISAPTPIAQSLATLIVACAEQVAQQLPNLRHRHTMKRVEAGIIELHRLENQADQLLREGVMDLFHNPHDPTAVIAWSRIYETMERVTDECEDIADVLRGLVIKHG